MTSASRSKSSSCWLAARSAGGLHRTAALAGIVSASASAARFQSLGRRDFQEEARASRSSRHGHAGRAPLRHLRAERPDEVLNRIGGAASEARRRHGEGQLGRDPQIGGRARPKPPP